MGNIEIADLQQKLIKLLCEFAQNPNRKVAIKKVVIDFDKTYITYAEREESATFSPDNIYESDKTDVYLNKYGE
jgi:hypothetical protein